MLVVARRFCDDKQDKIWSTLISSPDLVLTVRGKKKGGGGKGGEGRGGNEIWQNTIAWARIWPIRQLSACTEAPARHMYFYFLFSILFFYLITFHRFYFCLTTFHFFYFYLTTFHFFYFYLTTFHFFIFVWQLFVYIIKTFVWQLFIF